MAMAAEASEFMPSPIIESIQRKGDGSFVVICNGYPFHATEQETPSVYRKVLSDIESGAPVHDYVEPELPGEDALERERVWRNVELERVMWLRERHRDQVEMKRDTTLTQQEFDQLLGYIQALRDWPQSANFPNTSNRPALPEWVNDQLI